MIQGWSENKPEIPEKTRFIELIQVHGNQVSVVTPDGVTRPEADALVCNLSDVVIAVRTADCVPILMHDPENGVVAATHAGWRGTAKNISQETIMTMQKLFGSNPESLVVSIGPSICATCYEIGSDAADELAAIEPRCIENSDNRIYADLKLANRLLIEAAGVPAGSIRVSPECTMCSPLNLPSYRRSKDKRRIYSYIGL